MDNKLVEILLVEDSIDDAVLTIRALKKCGLSNSIYHVKDGTEALDFFYGSGKFTERKEHPKLVLLDLKMPKVSGIEVLSRLKSDPFIKSVPVVILTSSKEDPDVRRCYELGANSYIVKPVDSDNFFQAVKEIGLYWVILNQPAIG